MSPRRDPLADFLVDLLRHKGRGLHTAEMHFEVLDWIIARAIEGDGGDRIVSAPGGKYELRDVREARAEAFAREPDELDPELEWSPPVASYIVPSVKGGDVPDE